MGRFEGECSGKTLASVILLSIGSTSELSGRWGMRERYTSQPYMNSHISHMGPLHLLSLICYVMPRYDLE